MRQSTPNEPSNRLLSTLSGSAVLALVALGMAGVDPASSQTTPNWGTDATQTPASTTNQSPWGGTGTGTGTGTTAPMRSQHSPKHAAKGDVIPPELADILKRPDSDRITLTDGQSKTVGELRAAANKRRSVIEALKTGEVPAGRKRVRVAAVRSQQHEDLVSASKVVRDTARREAAASWANPGVLSETRSTGQSDPAAAWATPSTTSNIHSSRRQSSVLSTPGATPEIHTGVGTSSVPRSGSAFLRSTQTGSTEVSKQPAQAYVAQTIQPGIAIVNGHSKGVQFTPGGLYTVIGSGFGDAVGAVDLVDPQLPGGRLALQVTQWSDRKLQAQLPEPISGVADQPVVLRVTTRTGALYTMTVQFYATRQAITLTDNDVELNQAFDVNFGNQNDWNGPSTYGATVTRTKSGNNIDCPSVGEDSLRTKLPAGWALTEIAISTWLPAQGNSSKDFYGDDGDTVVSGGYSITQVPAGLTNQTYDVHWGVLRSHSTHGFSLIPKFTGNDFGWSGNDGCVSAYSLELTMVGPAGLRPF